MSPVVPVRRGISGWLGVLIVTLAGAVARAAAADPVRLVEDTTSFVLDNGLVKARILKRTGVLRSLQYRGLELLAQDVGGANGGYWSAVGRVAPGRGQRATVRIHPGTNGGARAEISCLTFTDPARPDGNVDIDIRYALGRDEPWLYTYAIWRHARGWPALSAAEARYALKLNPAVFDFMTIDAARRRVMPTGADWDRGEPLNLKEARRLTTGRYAGQAEHKYGYSAVLHETPAYGWSSTRQNVGLWIVNPSMEYLSGGPTKVELTGHLDVNPNGLPTLLNMWLGSHYGGSAFYVRADETWSKVIGPSLLYCNQGVDPDALWAGALDRARSEAATWPYSWVIDPDYPQNRERSRVQGRLLLSDSYAQTSQIGNVWVGLTVPEYPGPPAPRTGPDRRGFPATVDWQRDAKHYQFWVRTDASGRFTITKVRAGTYDLHAIADGILGAFTRTNVLIGAGKSVFLGDLVWRPIRQGRPLWEIGIPNRTAQEFRNGAVAWQWGTYLKYPKEFPQSVDFVIGQSDWRRDWNYVQPPRFLTDRLAVGSEAEEEIIPAANLWRSEVSNSVWKVRFGLPAAVAGRATLRLAFCGTHNGSRVEVRVNGQPTGNTGVLPSTSAMQRDSARAYWVERPIGFDAALLQAGTNTIELESHATTWSQGVMYDYLRLELAETKR